MHHKGVDPVPFNTSHLVQKNLTSRSRQQSEPPMNRNLFPPTPPPDTDKASLSSSGSNSGTRSQPTKAQRPPKLDLDRPGAQIVGRSSSDAAPEKRRIGTTRTASEPRGPSQQPRSYPPQKQGYSRDGYGHRRGASDASFGNPNGYLEDPYGTYGEARAMALANGGRPFQQQGYIDEEEEYGSSPCDDLAPEPGFEIMGAHQRTRSSSRGPARGHSRRPEVRKFRVKAHSLEDTRYIIIPPTIDFAEFETRIREKFGFKMLLKIKMQDEGDMITMVDQEDLDLLLMASREIAKREGSELGKMEVCFLSSLGQANDCRYGLKRDV